MTYSLKLTEDAENDLSNIYSYTTLTFGHMQATKYHDLLFKELERIRQLPSIGHKRRDIPEGYLAFQAGQHVILYRIESALIVVFRILHGRMDFTRRV